MADTLLTPPAEWRHEARVLPADPPVLFVQAAEGAIVCLQGCRVSGSGSDARGMRGLRAARSARALCSAVARALADPTLAAEAVTRRAHHLCTRRGSWFSGREPTGSCTDHLEHPAPLRQQLERLSVTWSDDGEVPAVERGDPDRAVPLG